MRYRFIDMHCDSLLKGISEGRLYDNPGNMFDVSRMVLAGQGAQFFAVFFPPRNQGYIQLASDASHQYSDVEWFELASGLLLETVGTHFDTIQMAYSSADLVRNMKAGLCSAVLTIEDARVVGGDIARLRWLYACGVRVLSMTWNESNCFGYPNSSDSAKMSLGLTEFGKEALSEMDELGILLDVSHLSDGGFWDVVQLTKKPFVATHSNCRALCDHPRNLSDEMIKALASKGGVAGVNFAPEFLAEDGKRESRVEDICRHVLHYINVGGDESIGLGTDFDGISGRFEISQPSEMEILFDALRKKDLSERQIEKFAYSNVIRVMRDAF